MNAFQRKMLVKARRRIEEGLEAFICVAIESAYAEMPGWGTMVYNIDVKDLKRQIERAIDREHTMEGYIHAVYGIRVARDKNLNPDYKDFWDAHATIAQEITYFPAEEFEFLMKNVRLAWIDRMLETNEVK